MVLAALPETRSPSQRSGAARFIASARTSEVCAELRAQRFLVAGLGSLGPASLARARLRETIDEAVEGALAMRGALPPSGCEGAELGASIRDQVFRASALGLAGIALALPRLREAADDRGELDPADAEALHAWIAASKEAPVLLLLDEADRGVRARMPVTLAQAVGVPSEGARARIPRPQAPVEAAQESEARPAAQEPEARPALPPRPAMVPIRLDYKAPEARAAIQETQPAPPPVTQKEETRTSPPPPIQRDEAPPPPPPAKESGSVERVLSAAERRTYAMELDNARGPKPVRVIDQLFVSRYIPLLAAACRGEADAFVRGVVDAWRSSFEHSYRESYATIRVTGKRPPMVFDAPEIASKIGRLNGARVIRLVLVDGMSFDLGERAMDRLRGLVSANAVCVERSLLWSALPTTTPQQIALLARGAEGLREDAPPSNEESEIARGRAISTIRRERVGAREVMRLDCVEARLKNAGPPYDERLDAIADEAAQALARFMEGQQPRTMLFIFGDHGFRMTQTPDGRATGPATQGGASPEEVLVPGYAWLVGGVH